MNTEKREISTNIIFTTLRWALLILISIQISLGSLTEYIVCFEADKIELAGEKDMETEEKDGKEESEKEKLANACFCDVFINECNAHTFQNIDLNYSLAYGEIPTPPPRNLPV